jgi:ABC-type Zn uptake system ZnuABC Zn-binding protein ZnuA
MAGIAMTAFVVLAAACGDDGGNGADGATSTAGDRLRVVTSLEIFADMARNVGGDRVDVEALLPSGSDPHTFELSPGRVRDVAEADIIFINGLDLEESIHDVIDNNASGRVVELAEGLPTLEGDPDEGEEFNPHLWLDARLGARYVERIRDELTALDSAGTTEYEANATAYLEELGQLDRDFEAAMQAIPVERRKLVTFHDAYPYLAARYGLEVVAVVVPSPGQEPNARDIADLSETLRSQDVPAAFKEPQFDAEVLELAAADTGVRVLDLLSDAYIEGVDSYIGLLRFDLAQLQDGLGGA